MKFSSKLLGVAAVVMAFAGFTASGAFAASPATGSVTATANVLGSSTTLAGPCDFSIGYTGTPPSPVTLQGGTFAGTMNPGGTGVPCNMSGATLTVNSPVISFDQGPPPTATITQNLTVTGDVTIGGLSVSCTFTVPSGTTLTSTGPTVLGPYTDTVMAGVSGDPECAGLTNASVTLTNFMF